MDDATTIVALFECPQACLFLPYQLGFVSKDLSVVCEVISRDSMA